MSTIVDLRFGRIGASCTRFIETAEELAISDAVTEAVSDGAEIILFPKIRASVLQRPRKRMKRRLSSRAQDLSAGAQSGKVGTGVPEKLCENN